MVLKIKKRVAIDIYQCQVFDKGSKTLVNRVERVKEGYPIEKVFLEEKNETLCDAELLETEAHDMALAINLDDMSVSVLKDEII